MEKLKPSFALADIKAAFADPGRLNRSFVSKQGADDLDMDDAGVVAAQPVFLPAARRRTNRSFPDDSAAFVQEALRAAHIERLYAPMFEGERSEV